MLATVPVELPDLDAAPDAAAAARAPANGGAAPANGGAQGGKPASWQALWAPMAAAASDDGGHNFLLGAPLA